MRKSLNFVCVASSVLVAIVIGWVFSARKASGFGLNSNQKTARGKLTSITLATSHRFPQLQGRNSQ